MNRLHLQVALDHCTLPEAREIAAAAAPLVDSVEVGTPLLIRQGIAVLEHIRERIQGHSCALFADTKISDEGVTIATLCFDAGADVLSVVDGASTETLRAVRTVADKWGRAVWVDLLSHSNPIIRARAIAPFVDGFVVHRPASGLPPQLVDELLSIDRPIRLAGGMTVKLARRAAERRLSNDRTDLDPHIEGIIVGRAITAAEDIHQALVTFSAICHPEESES